MFLEDQIRLIGQGLVCCGASCEGIERDPGAGILPRGLILEHRDPEGRGVLVAGVNPGRSTVAERAFYLSQGGSYQAVEQYWQEKIRRSPYYTRLRRLVSALGFSGPILWSDLAKCENAIAAPDLPPIQTLRQCSERFLRAEVAALPPEWPLVGVGAEGFKALAYSYPTRVVIGVPHPADARGWFSGLYTPGQEGRLNEEVAEIARTALESPLPIAVRLTSRSSPTAHSSAG